LSNVVTKLTVPPASGRTTSPRFERLRKLGSGGYGTVYEAREVATGARVALKELNDQTGESLLGFKQEFRTLSELSHPNVVRFVGLFEEAGRFYFTMELVEGEGLLDYVRPGGRRGDTPSRDYADPSASGGGVDSGIRGPLAARSSEPHAGRLDLPRLRSAMAQLASGLIVLHAAGLVHRDVKPQNVQVAPDGRAVLLDFGLARRLDTAHTGDLAGTFAYMAPEQALGKEVGAPADWYAFGAVLYEALTGRTPHAHLPVRNFWLEARGELPKPSRWVEDLPEDLSTLAADLLAFDPRLRPDQDHVAKVLGVDVAAARASASFRSRIHFAKDIFVAREREQHGLRAAFARASQGGSPIVRIEGDSGIGKSTLVERFVAELGTLSEAVILSSRCYEREAVPYRGVDGLIDALATYLAAAAQDSTVVAVPKHAEFLTAVFPVMQAVPGFETMSRPTLVDIDPREARIKAFDALRQLLLSLTERSVILIQLDDAQWIDGESVALLNHVLSDSPARIMLVLTTRPTSREALNVLLGEAADVTRLVLLPLSPSESEQLIRKLVERGGGQALDAAQLARTSAGHPLFIHELVVRGDVSADSGATLEGAISARLDALPASARALLDMIALAASPLPHAAARSASGLSAESYPWLLSTLRDENFVSFRALAEGDDVQAYHDRIREVIVSGMSAQARQQTHQRLALSLERECPDALDSLALHFAGSGAVEPTVRYARAAAERALETLSFENAAALLRLALRFEPSPVARAELECSLAEALANAGRGTEAAEAFLRAAPLVDDVSAIEVRRRAGEQLLRAGHVTQGTEILFYMLRQLGLSVPRWDFSILLSLMWVLLRLRLRGLHLTPRDGPVSVRARLRLDVCWTVATGLSVVHHLRATEFQGRTLLLALDAGDRDRVVKCAALLGVTLGMAGGLTSKLAAALSARARELAGPAPTADNTAWLRLTDGVARMGAWDFSGCEQLCGQAEKMLAARSPGASWEIVTAQAFGLWSAAFRGNFSMASARLPELIASARSRGDRHAETSLILSPLHLLGLGRDNPSEVRQETARIMSEWPSKLAFFQHMCGAYVLAQVDLYEARIDSAWSNVSYAWQMLRRGHLSQVQFQRVDLLGLRGRAALGQASVASPAARRKWLGRVGRDAQRLRREAIPSARGLAHLLEGGVLRLEQRWNDSSLSFARAAAEFDDVGMLLHARVARLAGCLSDPLRDPSAEKAALVDMGVSNPAGMLNLWLPGFNQPDTGEQTKNSGSLRVNR
jgi:hypothetical protein